MPPCCHAAMDSLDFQPQDGVPQCSTISHSHKSRGSPSHSAESAGQFDGLAVTVHFFVPVSVRAGGDTWHTALKCEMTLALGLQRRSRRDSVEPWAPRSSSHRDWLVRSFRTGASSNTRSTGLQCVTTGADHEGGESCLLAWSQR